MSESSQVSLKIEYKMSVCLLSSVLYLKEERKDVTVFCEIRNIHLQEF